MAKLMQHDPPTPSNIRMMYPALKGRLLETRGFLQNVQPDEIAGAKSHSRHEAREITSRHRVDGRSLLPLAARRDAVTARVTRLDLRMD